MISFIIVTHNSEREIYSCLESIRKSARDETAEVIVVDAGSTDETAFAVSTYPFVHERLTLRNVGFAAAANAGAARARGDLLFFLNPDTTLGQGAVGQLRQSFSSPRVSVVGGLLLGGNGAPERWQNVPFPSLRTIFSHHLPWSGRHTPRQVSDVSHPYSVPWVSGGALAVRRSVFDGVGGFRERYFLYFEDVEFCRRVRESGGLIVSDPRLHVVHERGRSADAAVRQRAYDRSQSLYLSVAGSLIERIVLRALRGAYRHWRYVLLLAMIVGVATIIAREVIPPLFLLFAATGIVLTALTARFPRFAWIGLLATLLLGQSVRVPLGGIFLTGTDGALLAVLLGTFLSIMRQGRLRSFARRTLRGWWVVAALAPGILLAFERLPAEDLLRMGLYAARLLLMLLIVPMVAELGLPVSRVRQALIGIALLLVGLGGLQLMLAPAIPPPVGSLGDTIFFRFSGGGWDPHRFRLVATWLDPNFLGGFFSMALAGLLAANPRRGKFLSPLFALVSVLLVLSALGLTQSRSAVLSLGSGLALLLFFSPARRRLAIVVTAGILLALFVPSIRQRIPLSLAGDPTVRLRLQSVAEGVYHVTRFPFFGVGYNAYPAEQEIIGVIRDAVVHSRAGSDNGLVTIMATTGAWGVTVLGIGLLFLSRRLLAAARYGESDALSVLSMFVVFLAHAQFLHSVTYVHLLVPLLITLGAWIGTNRYPSSGETRTIAERPREARA